MMKNSKAYLIILVGILISVIAPAQVQEELSPTELKQTTAITQPITWNKGFLRVGTSIFFSPFDKFIDDDGKKGANLHLDKLTSLCQSHLLAFDPYKVIHLAL